MSKDAIENDVSEAEKNKLVEEARGNANGQRLSALQELAIQRREQRDAEMAAEGQEVIDTSGGDLDDDGVRREADAEKAIEKELKIKNEDIGAGSGDAKKDEPGEEELRTIIVDGVEQQVPVSKILDSGVRTLQKEATADKRLQEATELLRQAKEQAASPSSQDVSYDSYDSPPSNVDAEQLAKTIIDGDLEEVTNAVQRLVGAGRQDSQQMATQVQNMDRSEVYGFVQDAINLEKAMNTFKDTPENGGFGDLYSDPTLRKMVMDKEEELVNGGDKRGYIERLTDAATEIREWRDGIMKSAGLSVADFDNVRDKKANATNTLESAGGRSTNTQEEKPKSRSEIRKSALAKIAASRGQPLD